MEMNLSIVDSSSRPEKSVSLRISPTDISSQAQSLAASMQCNRTANGMVKGLGRHLVSKFLVSLSGKITRGLRNILLARFQLFSSSAEVALSPEIAGTSAATPVARGLSTLTRGIWEYAQQIEAPKKEKQEPDNVQMTPRWATYAIFWYPAHSILLPFHPLCIFFVDLFLLLAFSKGNRL